MYDLVPVLTQFSGPANSPSAPLLRQLITPKFFPFRLLYSGGHCQPASFALESETRPGVGGTALAHEPAKSFPLATSCGGASLNPSVSPPTCCTEATPMAPACGDRVPSCHPEWQLSVIIVVFHLSDGQCVVSCHQKDLDQNTCMLALTKLYTLWYQ